MDCGSAVRVCNRLVWSFYFLRIASLFAKSFRKIHIGVKSLLLTQNSRTYLPWTYLPTTIAPSFQFLLMIGNDVLQLFYYWFRQWKPVCKFFTSVDLPSYFACLFSLVITALTVSPLSITQSRCSSSVAVRRSHPSRCCCLSGGVIPVSRGGEWPGSRPYPAQVHCKVGPSFNDCWNVNIR